MRYLASGCEPNRICCVNGQKEERARMGEGWRKLANSDGGRVEKVGRQRWRKEETRMEIQQ